MAEVTGMTPEKINQEIINVKSYVDGGLSEKADKSQVTSDLSKKANTTYVDSELSKKSDITYVNSELSKKTDKTYVDSVAPLKSFVGIGTPQGKVSAPIGSIYTDTEATNGAIRWVKISGTGTTGWTVEYGDTGWRNISAQLESGVLGNVFITRVNQTIQMVFHNIYTAGAGHTVITSLPIGFRPYSISGANWRNGTLSTDNGDTVRISSYHNGTMRVLNMPTGKYFGGSITMVSDNIWPTALPGTPA